MDGDWSDMGEGVGGWQDARWTCGTLVFMCGSSDYIGIRENADI